MKWIQEKNQAFQINNRNNSFSLDDNDINDNKPNFYIDNQNNINIIYNDGEDYLFDYISYDKLIQSNPLFDFMNNSIESKFDLNLYSSIININEANYETALKFIFSANKLILSNIKSLLTESYTRGYELLIKNQQLCLLEQIIEYKQYHLNDEIYLNEMTKYWDRGFDMIGQEDPGLYEKFLSIRALVLPIEKEFEKYMILSKIYRKKGMFNQCERILNRINKKLCDNNENEGDLKYF